MGSKWVIGVDDLVCGAASGLDHFGENSIAESGRFHLQQRRGRDIEVIVRIVDRAEDDGFTHIELGHLDQVLVGEDLLCRDGTVDQYRADEDGVAEGGERVHGSGGV